MSAPKKEILALDLWPVRQFLAQDTESLIDQARADPVQFERWVVTLHQAHDMVRIALAVFDEAQARVLRVCDGIEALNTYERGPRTERLQ